MAQDKVVRLGGAGGFAGDSSIAATQIIRKSTVDYLIFDVRSPDAVQILERMEWLAKEVHPIV